MEVQSAYGGAASAAAAALGMPDPFHIDDLLDFSNEDIAGPIGEGGFPLSSLDSTVNTAAAGAETVNGSTSPGAPPTGSKHLLDAGPDGHPADVLCVPCDDLAELEWLSKFVEDSFSMGETPTRACNDLSVSCEDMHFESSYSCKDRFQSASPVSVLESSASSGNTRAGSCAENNNAQSDHPHHPGNLLYRDLSVPGRARSKRARTGGRVWGNSRILSTSSASTTDTESLSSDSNVLSGEGGAGAPQSSSSALSADSGAPQQQSQQQRCNLLLMMTPPPKAVTTMRKPWKPNGKSGSSSSSTVGKKQHDGGAAVATPQPWRCLHCATQRTPQWRAGPMGPKTLCNACGVRYKSGRLLPEYRPAGSPGYVGHKHSNSHKKILEMRRQRENNASSCPSPHQHPQQDNSNRLAAQLYPSPSSLVLEDDSTGVCTSQN